MKGYWHIYHDELLGFSDNIEERIAYIKTEKPVGERPLRIRLLREMRGELPEVMVKAGAALCKAWAAADAAWAARDKAWAALRKAGAAYNEARVALDKARAAYNKAEAALYEVRAAYDKAIADHLPAIEALHRQECPGCPWDGGTIFPESGRER